VQPTCWPTPTPFHENRSFEEARAAFLPKGKSLLDPPRPLRNLIGDSSTWRQGEWPNTVGNSLPRTPVGQTRLYPDLTTVVETVEPIAVDGPVEPGESLQVRRNRTGRIKGGPPIRASERLKERAAQFIPPTKAAQVADNYLDLVNNPESANEDDDFGSSKSHIESDVDDDSAAIEARVEAEFREKRAVAPATTGQPPFSLTDTSTPFTKPQNVYTTPFQHTTGKPTPSSTQRVETQAQPFSGEPLASVPTFIDNQDSASKRAGTRATSSRYLNSSNPFRQALPMWKPLQFLLPNPFQQTIKPQPHKPSQSPMTQPSPFEVLYLYLREKGASREDAAAEAKAASVSTESVSVTSVMPSPDVVLNQIDCSAVANQSYYNRQKLLQNQQQQTIALLAQVPAFNGIGSTKFEDWIQHFERVVDTAEFEEGRKIKLLGSKLFGSAGDCITTFQLNYPKEAQSFIKVKQKLHERFHGGDNRKMYFTEFKNCIRNSGESIRDYACRLQKLYSFAYPTEVGKTVDPAVLQLRETMLMDGFLGGLKPNLRERMSFKDYKNLNDLVKATEKCAAVLSEAKLEKRSVEFVNAASATTNAREMRETKNEIADLKVVIGQLSQQLSITPLDERRHEAINSVTATQNAQMSESRKEIEELKDLLKASNKSYSEMLKQSREAEKAMRNLQLQVAGMSQPNPQARPIRQLPPQHGSQFFEHSTPITHHPPGIP